MANEVQDLSTQVDATEGAEASAVVLINGFAAYVSAHANDPAALRSYVDRLRAGADNLAAAVVANPVPTDAPAP